MSYRAWLVQAKAEAVLRTDAEHVLAADAHGSAAKQAWRIDVSLRAGNNVRFQLVFAVLAFDQPQRVDPASVVSPVPLHVNGAVFGDALPEGRGVFIAVKTGHLANKSQPCRVAFVLKKNRSSAGGDHDRFLMNRNVPRATEVVLPVNSPVFVFVPFLAAPAITVKADDFFDEVPLPGDVAIRLDGVDLRTQRREVDSTFADARRAENRIAAVDHANDLSGLAIEHAVPTAHRAEVEKLLDNRRRADIVAVVRPAPSRRFPHRLESLRVKTERHSRTVNDVHVAVGDHGRGINAIAQRHGRDQAQRRLNLSILGISRMPRVELVLQPVLGRDAARWKRDGEKRKHH